MAASTVEQIRQLIAGSELIPAATSLSQAWRGKDETLYNLATALTERCNALERETLQGIISRPDAELERARIIDALLFLTNRLTNPSVELPRHLRTYFPEIIEKPKSRNGLILAISAILVIAVAYFFMQSAFQSSDFTLTVVIKGAPTGTQQNIQLFFGHHLHTSKALDNEGKAIFTDIPNKFSNDSATIELENPAYRIARQSAPSFAKSDKGSIIFEVEAVTQYTDWRGKIMDAKGDPIAGATLEIDSGLATGKTDAQGNFVIKVPKAAGEEVQVDIYVQAKRLRSSLFTLSETIPAQITIE